MNFGQNPWEILVAVLLGVWIGWFLRDTLLRWRRREAASLLQSRLEDTTRKAEKVLRAVKTEAAHQQKALRMMENLQNVSRRHQESAHEELVGVRALGRMMEGLVESLKTVKPADATRRVPVSVPVAGAATAAGGDALAAVESQLAECMESLQASQSRLSDAESRAQMLDLRLESAMHQERQAARAVETMKRDLAASHEALFKCDERVNQREEMIGKLQIQLEESLRSTVGEDELAVEARYLTLVAEKEQRIGDLEQELEILSRRLVDGDDSAVVAEREERIAVLENELEELAVQAASAGPKAAGRAAATDVEEDDLKRIRGIGPALERRLREIGIRTYHQIAHWNDDEIDRVAEQLGRFGDRIRRDNWVEGAREQYCRKYERS